MRYSYKATYYTLFIFCFLLYSNVGFSQNDKQKQLESRRQELNSEINKINKLRKENSSKAKSQLFLIENVNYKINVSSNLIKVTNQQANLLTRQIKLNENRIADLKVELKQLKKDYADMIVKSYKSKNKQSKLMFLLSSDNFKQAYKRIQYINQYKDHQREQAEIIKSKTKELEEINQSLLKQQAAKEQLIADKKAVQMSLEEERQSHQSLMATIQKDLSKYTAQIKKKQREANRIDRQIDKMIKEAIAKSNKKAGKRGSTSTFALTKEEKVLASNFTSNKGKLPWPVVKGYLRLGYGTQPHPINKSLKIKSNGVRIATEKGSEVRAVFDGEVSEILRMRNVNPIVMIRHGDYLTLYRNLSKVYVKKGDKVKTKQAIGVVATNASTGETILSFTLSKGTSTENPANWIYKM